MDTYFVEYLYSGWLNSRGQQTFPVKCQIVNILHLESLWSLLQLLSLPWNYKSSHKHCINECGCVPIKCYLWTIKSEYHNFYITKYFSLDLFNHLKIWKNILSLRVIKTGCMIDMACRPEFTNPCYTAIKWYKAQPPAPDWRIFKHKIEFFLKWASSKTILKKKIIRSYQYRKSIQQKIPIF